jgi:fused signal recognition particle receptor
MEPLLLAIVIAVLVVVLVVGLLVGARRKGGVATEEHFEDELKARGPTGTDVLPDRPTEGSPSEPVDLLEPQVPDDLRDLEPPPGEPGGPPAGTDLLEPPAEALEAPPAEAPEAPPLSAFERFRLRLGKTRNNLGASIAGIFGRGITEDAWEELEEALIAADVGVDASLEIVEGLRQRARDEGLKTGEEALALLKEVLRVELAVADRSLQRRPDGTTVWLVTGVNGSGKTTSIGKLAARHTRNEEKVVLAAADTFRAAASEQLQLWGERSGARVVRHDQGADPAAVAFDGYQAAKAAKADLLLVDTAGRLQNKKELMDELSKVKRVLERDAGPSDEVLLVIDGTTGQNGLSQAKAFLEAVDVSGVILTKLDGTAKGGIVIAIQRQLGIPVKLVGLGEEVDDLADFDPDAFVEALFAEVAQTADLYPDMAEPGVAAIDEDDVRGGGGPES